MRIPSKQTVILQLQEKTGIILNKIPGMQIMFTGNSLHKKEFVVCTPESKMHNNGYGWVDITVFQKECGYEGFISFESKPKPIAYYQQTLGAYIL